MDWQRNDRLGRIGWLQHGREIHPQHGQLDSYHHHERANCARWSHGSMDWQRDDRLGRPHSTGEWPDGHRFQHRRQILRLGTQSNTTANTYAASHTHPFAVTDASKPNRWLRHNRFAQGPQGCAVLYL